MLHLLTNMLARMFTLAAARLPLKLTKTYWKKYRDYPYGVVILETETKISVPLKKTLSQKAIGAPIFY